MPSSKRSKARKKPLPASEPTPSPGGDDDLVDDLIAQLDSLKTDQAGSAAAPNSAAADKPPHSSESTQKQGAKNRFKARQARKAANLAQTYAPSDPEADRRLKRDAEVEEQTLNRICKNLDLQIHQIKPDGHCLFAAVADQLSLLSILPTHEANPQTARLAAASYISSHEPDFLPFLPSDGEDGENDGLMSPLQFQKYCLNIRDTGQWGGEPEILALSRAYNVPIHVVQHAKPTVVRYSPTETLGESDQRNRNAVWVSYHRKLFGLGEHYNSLRPSKTTNSLFWNHVRSDGTASKGTIENDDRTLVGIDLDFEDPTTHPDAS